MMVCLLLLTAGVTAARFRVSRRSTAAAPLRRCCRRGRRCGQPEPDVERRGARSPTRSPLPTNTCGCADRMSARSSPSARRPSTRNAATKRPITFGALFGYPTLARTVTSTSQPIRRQNALADPTLVLPDVTRSPKGPRYETELPLAPGCVRAAGGDESWPDAPPAPPTTRPPPSLPAPPAPASSTPHRPHPRRQFQRARAPASSTPRLPRPPQQLSIQKPKKSPTAQPLRPLIQILGCRTPSCERLIPNGTH